MHIILFAHPAFLGSQSMPRYAEMLCDGLRKKGHEVQIWTAQPKMYALSVPKAFKKWLGYFDQYILFPKWIGKQLKQLPADTLFVFTDHALGPWVPLVADRPHVIHCHDFLAQRSALGEIPQNPTGWSGRIYQKYIRNGYRKGKNFISISQNTQKDLHRFLGHIPVLSEVVYNGLNQDFKPLEPKVARQFLSEKLGLDLDNGYILHVGGNQWYKNRKGVLAIYFAWRAFSGQNLPLLMLGREPSAVLQHYADANRFGKDVYWMTSADNEMLKKAYAGATVLLYPSLAEGFGWPIAEAMASGCPVITTGAAPMNEVGADAAFYIKPMSETEAGQLEWAKDAAIELDKVIRFTDEERSVQIEKGLANVQRFATETMIDGIENIYKKITGESR